MFEVLTALHQYPTTRDYKSRSTHARTFENSEDGDITKLSFVLDHEIKCWMVWSSSML
jgi:hypothetical protein